MVDVLMLFPSSADQDDVDSLLARLVPSLKQAPGLRSLKVSAGQLMSRGGPPPFVRVLEASFDSLADWMAQVPSPDRTEERDAFDRVNPLVLFFEVSEA